MSLRVVVADDQTLFRDGVARLLEDAGFEVVGRAADAPDLLRKVRAHKPDVAVVDVQMPPGNADDGLQAAIAIRAELPDIGVVVLSQYVAERYALDLIGDRAAGVGYLLKDRVADTESFAEAIRQVSRGGVALDPEVVARMVGRRRRHDPLDDLTPREREVLRLMAEGLSNQGIGRRLGVGAPAVEKHVTRIFGKLELGQEPTEHRRVLAVLKLLRASQWELAPHQRP